MKTQHYIGCCPATEIEDGSKAQALRWQQTLERAFPYMPAACRLDTVEANGKWTVVIEHNEDLEAITFLKKMYHNLPVSWSDDAARVGPADETQNHETFFDIWS